MEIIRNGARPSPPPIKHYMYASHLIWSSGMAGGKEGHFGAKGLRTNCTNPPPTGAGLRRSRVGLRLQSLLQHRKPCALVWCRKGATLGLTRRRCMRSGAGSERHSGLCQQHAKAGMPMCTCKGGDTWPWSACAQIVPTGGVVH